MGSTGTHLESRREWIAPLLTLILIGSGCSGADGQLLRAWTFALGDSSRQIEFPVHLDDELPERVLVYRLTAEVDVAPSLCWRG
jgi:hypothetical protein